MVRVVFRGGGIFDGERHRTGWAVVVAGDRIEAVVPDGELGDLDGTTEVVDLDGGLLAPGFIDAHVHAVQGGLERIRCDLSDVGGRAEYAAAVAAYAGAHPDEPWVLGGGWSMADFPGGQAPSADLDAVVADRPVYLLNRDHHGAWVNSRTLAVAGIDRSTPDPPDGHLDRDADGNPTGTLHEGAMDLVADLLPPPGTAELDRALVEAQRYLHSLGVTGWQDAILGDYAGMRDPSETYLRAVDAGRLTASVTGALWWERGRGTEQVAGLRARRDRFTRGRLRATSVKVMADGIIENGTAALGAPYRDRCGHPTGSDGHSFLAPEALVDAVQALAAAGFQVHVHAIGDRAVREALDAFAAAAGLGEDLRHHIAHLQLVDPADVPRFEALGVTANLQALWACHDAQMTELTLPFLDADRAGWQYVFGDLARAGTRLAAGSDWPVSTPDPLAAIHVAVNRTAYAEDGDEGHLPLLPGQALTLEQAFAAYTSGSAFVHHRDDAGRLASGCVADLVRLDRDVFAGTPDEIGAARVIETWIDGVRVLSDL